MKIHISRSIGCEDKTMELNHLNLKRVSLLLLIPVLLQAKGESHSRFFERQKNNKITSHTVKQPAYTDRRKVDQSCISSFFRTFQSL